MVCIDDFALKKRKSYGTIMVDIQTHEIVDMIPSRRTPEVIAWLKTFPNISIVSRDGSKSYRKAIKEALPDAKQISDRFHIVKNFTEKCHDYLKGYFDPRVLLNKPNFENLSSNEEAMVVLGDVARLKLLTLREKFEGVKNLISSGHCKSKACKKFHLDIRLFKKLETMTLKEREKHFSGLLGQKRDSAIKRKQKTIETVKSLFNAQMNKTQISKELGLDFKTVKKYLELKNDDVNAFIHTKRTSILDPYIEEIRNGIKAGLNGKQIYNIIQSAGYKGSTRSLRLYIANFKTEFREDIIAEIDGQKIEWVSRKNLIKLCYKPLKKIKTLSEATLAKILKRYPEFANLYNLIVSFKTILANKAGHSFENWLEKVENSDSRELQSFATGIKADLPAVKNGILFSFNNGLAEGFVNKLKVIKRIMYGRCDFSTLKTKLLLIQNWVKIN
jgi:hypothetical protein